MRTIRIFQPGSYEVGQSVWLSPEASHHVGVVLRLRANQNLVLFNGTQNEEYVARIIGLERKKIQVMIEQKNTCALESPCTIHLVQAVAKGDRMEWVVQKAVELGVASITPVVTQRSAVRLDAERWEKKRHQWEAIAIAACEQSGRTLIPLIHPVCDLSTHFAAAHGVQRFILHTAERYQSFKDLALTRDAIEVLIGPEGGFDDQELRAAQQAGYVSMGLGPRVLRTETAAVAVMSILQVLVGDL